MEAKDTLWHINWGDGDNFYVIAPDKETAISRMLDGKDMVNSVAKLDHLYSLIFKAGYNQSLQDHKHEWDDNYYKGKQVGRKEVVEWVEEWNFWDNLSDDIHREWQAKLKEWRI